ncbi:hypothetical protein AVEN_243268-1 [Araneus ventricosus]|uniref:Uncharacterized protein n=1 Tax=Araneus ventricosus TaxID=182803 RepID=A0A4Y2M7E9_ARAVE|nr:hypothetical protein AVEN_243268-1 [Araneus ventricosus]
MPASRALETSELRRDRLEEDRLRMSASRAIETPEVRRNRLEEDRHRRAACLAWYLDTALVFLDVSHSSGVSSRRPSILRQSSSRQSLQYFRCSIALGSPFCGDLHRDSLSYFRCFYA